MAATDYADFTRLLTADIREHGKVTSGPLAGRPLMVLTTTGAKTGASREAIVTFTRDGDRYVIAGSKSGAPTIRPGITTSSPTRPSRSKPRARSSRPGPGSRRARSASACGIGTSPSAPSSASTR